MHEREQIFKSVFAAAWKDLPPVFQKRYSNLPYSNNMVVVEGTMDINFSKLMSFFMPLFRLFHVLVPYRGKNIPVRVELHSKIDSEAVFFNRTFYFPKKKPYEFNSRMHACKANDVIEVMSYGIAWQTHYFYDGKKVVMQHKRYIWRIFGFNIPVPLEILIGRGHAEEEIIDDNSYRMSMTMVHPLLGTMYSYSGTFTFKENP